MNDFQFVALGELSLCPAIARDEFAVEFDGDTVGLEVEWSEDIGDGGNGGEAPFLAIDYKSHSAARREGMMRVTKPLKPISLLFGFGNAHAPGTANRSKRVIK